MYVILGATGNTGAEIAELLLAKRQSVRVVGRSKERLTRFTSRGADGFVADVTDSVALEKAFQGARAVYALIPPNMTSTNVRAYQDEVVASIAKALEASGVKHVVALSSFGADKPDKTGPVIGLHVLEERLAKIPNLNVLFLRAGYFMENLLPQVEVIKNFGMMAGPVKADLPLPMIATRDIASVAGEALLELNFSGHQSRELQGQRDVTYLEVARIIGTAIGRPALAYVQLPGEQVIQAMTQMGMSKNMASLIVEMADSLNSGYMRMLESRGVANTNPTPLERFVQDAFLPAFRGQATTARAR
jgi:uncharacterized protein YbjT (DUF2867 family)